MRLAYYAGASTAAAAACLLKAFYQRPNFYSASVYLSQSNACLLIITNLLLVMACGFLYTLQRLLYGPLRPIEIEQLSEKAWYAVLDTLLAMPSFREDVGGWLLTMFVLLLAGKVWGWIGEGRVDVLEQQPPANPTWFHLRLASSLLLSVGFALAMLKYSVESVVEDPRPGMMVIFTFEFAVLVVFSVFTLARYALAVVEMGVVKKQTLAAIEARKSEVKAEREAAKQAALAEGRDPPEDEGDIEVDENEVDVPGWEEKRRYLFALEVFTDFVKLVIYIVFFTVSITFNGLPMHIMRDVYMTFASFSKRVSDYVAYRKATSDMNTRYPDATTEEIRDDACIVCRESMVAWAQHEPQQQAPAAGQQPDAAAPAPTPAPAVAPTPARRRDEGLRAKKLPCGHILHLRCLKAWLERQQVCPTCRRPVISATAPSATAAAGGNPPGPGQPGQPGQQPEQRRPRGRIFNLGPLRVGLVNAPGGQVQNIINQLQDPDAAAAQQAQAAQRGVDVAQPGAATAIAGQNWATNAAGARTQLPFHVQLMMLEQRAMQEAHNLNVDQQQLAYLRLMEAELGRLRAQRVPAQPLVGINGQPVLQPLPQHGVLPMQQIPNMQEQLQGNPNQQLGNGNESLPAGMVLPEGWAVIPLQRIGGPPGETHIQYGSSAAEPQAAVSQGAEPSNSTTPPTSVFQDSVAMDPATTTAQATEATAPPLEQAGTCPHGPTDEGGSPLFVPTQETLGSVTGSSTRTASAQLPSDAPQTLAASNPVLPSPENRPPWGGESWSSGGQAEQVLTPQHASHNGHLHNIEQQEGQGSDSHTGKGKAKAVEVEDVPDKDM